MSGGSFDFAFSRTANFAADLEMRLMEPHQWPPEMAARLARIAADAHRISQEMHAAEWLYSGDIGEETFMAMVGK